MCHQADARGQAGQYPPLRGRIAAITRTQAGRDYVARVLITGLMGPIKASGGTYVGYMPSFKALPDDTLAAILSYLASLDAAGPTTPPMVADLARARATQGGISGTMAVRHALEAQGVVR